MALLETMHLEGQDYTFKQLRHLLEKQAGVGQEGVVAQGDYKATQRGAGANMSVDVAAGDAWVKMDTGTRNGLYLQTNDGVVNVPVGAAHATLPRLDQLVLQVNDTNVAGALNVGELKILPGTATAGATLANRLGAAAVGNDRFVVADILVPAASVTVVNANLRDRRPWACGIDLLKVRPSAAHSYVGAALVAIDAVNYSARVESSGKPIVVDFVAPLYIAPTGTAGIIALFIDGVEYKRAHYTEQSGIEHYRQFRFEVPASAFPAGSRELEMRWGSAGTYYHGNVANMPGTFHVKESVQPTVANA